jgi:hypothetical protein
MGTLGLSCRSYGQLQSRHIHPYFKMHKRYKAGLEIVGSQSLNGPITILEWEKSM